MKILFVIGKYPNYGGTEKMTTILANSFVKCGYSVCIASFEQPHPELAVELQEKVRLYSLSYPVSSASNIRSLRHIIETHHINLIINQWCLPFYVTKLLNRARKRENTKLISVLHGVPNRSKKIIVAEDEIKQSKGLKRIIAKWRYRLMDSAIRFSLRYVYRNSDKYVVLSPCFIDSFCSYTKQNKRDKLIAIGNPITVRTDFAQESLFLKEKILLYVGRMDMENKRVNRIIEAWEKCEKVFNDWRLILVGDGPHKSELETYVKEQGIQRVEFTGFIKEEPIEYYKKASVLLLTSDLEGFGLVIVEGMSFGTVPCVYGSYESVYDIIKNGETGIITPAPYKRDDMVNALTSLMTDENLRITMAKKALEASRNFELDKIIYKWVNLFGEMTQSKL